MHNSLQGKRVEWTAEMWDTWLEYNRRNAGDLYAEYDIVFVHDPQPAPILHFMGDRRGSDTKWIWRCHIDLTDAQPDVWANLQTTRLRCASSAWRSSSSGVRRADCGGLGAGIDPLDEKNVPMTIDEAARVLEPFGVDSERPIMAQVSRFDPWKDPWVSWMRTGSSRRRCRDPADNDRADGCGRPRGARLLRKDGSALQGGTGRPSDHELQGMTDREVNAVQTLAR